MSDTPKPKVVHLTPDHPHRKFTEKRVLENLFYVNDEVLYTGGGDRGRWGRVVGVAKSTYSVLLSNGETVQAKPSELALKEYVDRERFRTYKNGKLMPAFPLGSRVYYKPESGTAQYGIVKKIVERLDEFGKVIKHVFTVLLDDGTTVQDEA